MSSEPSATYPGLRWLPSGDELVYVLANLGDKAPNGLWTVAVETGKTRAVRRAEGERWPARLLAVSARGEALLSYVGIHQPDAEGAYFELVDLASGDARSFAPSDLTASIDRVAFSPDGARAIYVDAEAEHLVVRDLATGEEVDLLADLPVGERPDVWGDRLDWATNDLVYVGATQEGGTLFRLGAA